LQAKQTQAHTNKRKHPHNTFTHALGSFHVLLREGRQTHCRQSRHRHTQTNACTHKQTHTHLVASMCFITRGIIHIAGKEDTGTHKHTHAHTPGSFHVLHSYTHMHTRLCMHVLGSFHVLHSYTHAHMHTHICTHTRTHACACTYLVASMCCTMGCFRHFACTRTRTR